MRIEKGVNKYPFIFLQVVKSAFQSNMSHNDMTNKLYNKQGKKTMSVIKINRVNKSLDYLPMKRKEIWDSIPNELIDRLTSSELVLVCQALDDHWQKAIAHAEKEIIDNEFAWCKRRNIGFDLVKSKD